MLLRIIIRMSAVIHQIQRHVVGHCDCCDGYRCLHYLDREIGPLCWGCGSACLEADKELNCGRYQLQRPESLAVKRFRY
jgi:hypothetical protein